MNNTDQPPSYEQAQAQAASHTGSSSLQVPRIPTAARRSMEDESRSLPQGWIRLFDDKENHQFFVDTKTSPPRAIWHHPYDDEEYLQTLSSEERERLQELHRTPTKADLEVMSTDEEDKVSESEVPLPPRPSGSRQGPTKKEGFGRRLKDKVTGTTHEERERERQRRAEVEQKQYEQHLAFRKAMHLAQQTGQPQLLGKDKGGHDLYIEPPNGLDQGYGAGGYGYNPYRQGPYNNPYREGPYGDPNARFIRPPQPYQRPYGYGYGGGYGLPLAGGLLGGALLGGLLF